MKIDVTDISRTFGRQTRAYAEYRIFASGWANDFLADRGFHLSGMRAIRDRIRAS